MARLRVIDRTAKSWHLDSVKQYAESYFQESISLRVVEEAKV